MRLNRRLTLTFTGVTMSVLLVSFSTVYAAVLRSETAELDGALGAQARTAAELALVRSPQRPSIADGLSEMPEVPTPTTRYAVVYGAGGDVISATRSFAGAAPSFSSLGVDPAALDERGVAIDIASHDGKLRGVVLPIGERRLYLLYAVSRAPIDSDMAFLGRLFALLFVGAVGSTVLVARWLGAGLCRDVEALGSVARRVADGDLTARVDDGARGSQETLDLGRDLDHMVSQLDALVSAQRTFVSYAAHELRSPLATLRGELQLALRRPRDADEYRAFIGESLSEVEQLVTLAEDLLTLARVQRANGHSSRTALADLLTDALRMSRGLADERLVKLVGPGGEVSPDGEVVGERPDLARALRNLVDNAIAHSPQGASVRVDLDRGPGVLNVRVEDEGEGVRPEDAPHIFAPFFRGSKDQSGERAGAGLGLAIAREIARSYGGDVTLDKPGTTPGRGASFRLHLRPAPGDDAERRVSAKHVLPVAG